MDISAVTSTTGTSASNNLTMQDFLQVLLTQLTYQDPMKPVDNQQFMAQVAQFTALQQTHEMNANIAQLLANQSALQSIGLLGRTADVTVNGASMTGTISAVSLAGTSPTITLAASNGQTLPNLPLSQITAVR